jgi:2-amino-4-hydroxy-6-hydroxymethyldihydropteridine diphosphokinase
VLIGLGANRGDRIAAMAAAVGMLARRGVKVLKVSSVYLTEPVGVKGQPWFHNAAVAVETRRSSRSLLGLMHEIERGLGRKRRAGPRAIDLDLLLHGARVVVDGKVIVPHPRLHERAFALVPGADAAPSAVHPVLGATIPGLLASLKTADRVKKLPATAQRRFRMLLGPGGIRA